MPSLLQQYIDEKRAEDAERGFKLVIALIRYFKRFPEGSFLGFENWRKIAERVAPL